MVSTYQQYLCPDFVSPINNSTALDSNKSPLALLAQTCNSIGLAEPHSPHQQQPHGLKRKHSFDSTPQVTTSNINGKEKLAPTNVKEPPLPLKQHKTTPLNNKSVSKPSPHQADSTTSSGDVSPVATSNNNNNNNNCGLSPKHTGNDKRSNCNSSRLISESATVYEPSSATAASQSSLRSTSHTTSKSPAQLPISAGGCSAPLHHSLQSSQIVPPPAAHYLPLSGASALPAAGSTTSSLTSSTAGLNPFFGVAGFLYPTHPSAASTFGLSAGGCYPPVASIVPPYCQGSMTSPLAVYPKICLDPYCKTCPAQSLTSSPSSSSSSMQVTPHSHQVAASHRPPCPPGCAQCNVALAVGGVGQPDFSAWLGAYSSLLNASGTTNGQGLSSGAAMLGGSGQGSLVAPYLPPYYSSMLMAVNPLLAGHGTTASPLASASIHHQVAHQQQQPVCWWDNGDGFCMKRFSNADEFFQHLRSHAQESAQKVNSVSSSNNNSNNNSNISKSNSSGNNNSSSTSSAPSLLPSVASQPIMSPSSGSYSNPANIYGISNPSSTAIAYGNLSRFYPALNGSGGMPKFGLPSGLLPPSTTLASDIPSASAGSLASYNAALLSSMLMQQQHRLPGSLPYP